MVEMREDSPVERPASVAGSRDTWQCGGDDIISPSRPLAFPLREQGPTLARDKTWLRCTLQNPFTDEADLLGLLETIRAEVRAAEETGAS